MNNKIKLLFGICVLWLLFGCESPENSTSLAVASISNSKTNSNQNTSDPTARYKTADTLYCYAKSGLVLRDKPDPKGAKLAVVTLGDDVIVVDPVAFTHAHKVNEPCGMEIKGFWVLVSYKGKQGYLFDGYLLQHELLNNLMEEDYWDRRSKAISKMNEPPNDGVEYMDYRKAEWKNGVKLFFSGYVGGNTTEITFPKGMFSFQEAFLFATADQSNSGENPLICECNEAKETIDCAWKDQMAEFHLKRDANGDIFITESFVD